MSDIFSPLIADSKIVLLLDDFVVAEARNCRQTFYAATKDPSNPVITATEPWEGRGPYTWNTRLLKNPETGQYELYYIGFRVEDNHYRWGLAVSDDGLTWTRPALNIESFDGRPARNMLTAGPHPDKAVRTVVRDPRPECPEQERYKGLRFTYDGVFASYSRDGRRWEEYPGNPVWRVASDAFHALWDPQRERFTAYYKVWEVHGQMPDTGGAFRPFIGHFPTFGSTVNQSGLAELRGPQIHFDPAAAASVKDTTVLLKHGPQSRDDGGGASLTGAWYARRVQGWAESEDWLNWRHERVVLRNDERDRPDANIQYMFVIPYGVYYLAFLTLHDDRGHFEQQLAFSRDGVEWSRPWRGSFIGRGPAGAFDSGMAGGVTDPIVTDTQLLFYYGGFTMQHHEPMSAPWQAAIGRAVLRRDGFVSWDAGHKTGVLTTRPVVVSGRRLLVNADAEGGRITVEVVDAAGRTIPGFERKSSVALTEDSTNMAGCLAPARWKSGRDFSGLSGRPVVLRFYLNDARIFSFGMDD